MLFSLQSFLYSHPIIPNIKKYANSSASVKPLSIVNPQREHVLTIKAKTRFAHICYLEYGVPLFLNRLLPLTGNTAVDKNVDQSNSA